MVEAEVKVVGTRCWGVDEQSMTVRDRTGLMFYDMIERLTRTQHKMRIIWLDGWRSIVLLVDGMASVDSMHCIIGC